MDLFYIGGGCKREECHVRILEYQVRFILFEHVVGTSVSFWATDCHFLHGPFSARWRVAFALFDGTGSCVALLPTAGPSIEPNVDKSQA